MSNDLPTCNVKKTGRQTDIQIDKKTERQTVRQTDRHKDRQFVVLTNSFQLFSAVMSNDLPTCNVKKTDRQTDIQIDKKTERQTVRQTDRQTQR
jgi:hypothetical protein